MGPQTTEEVTMPGKRLRFENGEVQDDDEDEDEDEDEEDE